MHKNKENSVAQRPENKVSVPKVPKQFIDVFGKDVEKGDFGLSAEKVDIIFSYLSLQDTLDNFKDLTFSLEFIGKLPEELKTKLGVNLFPGVPLSKLEVPTTDKVVLAQLLAVDRLTEVLSKEPVEVWVTQEIKKELENLGVSHEIGLQHINYEKLDLEAKSYLVRVMEMQEGQVHTILAAKKRFPEGIGEISILGIFSKNKGKIKFDKLYDLETQYKTASRALDNPFLVHLSELKNDDELENYDSGKIKQQIAHLKTEEDEINVQEEAKTYWWNPEMYASSDLSRINKIFEEVAAFLRPKYANKTIFEIFGANTSPLQEEVLSAFWRTGEEKIINFGDEPWIKNNLYLKRDGSLELGYQDEVWKDSYDEKSNSLITGPLSGDVEVAMVDQTIKWIRQELLAMKTIKETWKKSGFTKNALVEITLLKALEFPLDPKIKTGTLPKWFLDILNKEFTLYDNLINFSPEIEMEDFMSLFISTRRKENHLKSYLKISKNRLDRYKRIIINPQQLYAELELEPTASELEVKNAYRKIAQETRAIHISQQKDFDSKEWEEMNEKFINATRAYSILSRRKLGKTHVTSLGKLSSYFEVT